MTALILLADFLETQIEIWRPVVGFPDYDVSNLGRVRSWYASSSAKRRGKPKILAQTVGSKGRMVISIHRDKKIFTRRIHRLVAQAFIPNPENRPQVNHLTGLYTDNRQGNLEWATKATDLEHAMKYGLVPHGIDHALAKITPEIVREIRARCANGEPQPEIAADFGITQSNVSCIYRRVSWKRVE